MQNGLYQKLLQQTDIELKPNEELLEFFLQEGDYSECTKEGYASDFKYILEKLGHKNLQRITARDILQFQQNLKRCEDFGVSRKRRLTAALRAFYRRISKIFPGEYYFAEFPEFEDGKFKEHDTKTVK